MSLKFPVEQGLGHQAGSASRTSLASYARWSRQKLKMRNGNSCFLLLLALLPLELKAKCVVRLLTGGALTGRRMCHSLHEQAHTEPSCEEHDQPVSLGCQLVLSVLAGTKHLDEEAALTAIASSVANITSTGTPVVPSRLVSPARCCCKALGLPPICPLQSVFDVP